MPDQFLFPKNQIPSCRSCSNYTKILTFYNLQAIGLHLCQLEKFAIQSLRVMCKFSVLKMLTTMGFLAISMLIYLKLKFSIKARKQDAQIIQNCFIQAEDRTQDSLSFKVSCIKDIGCSYYNQHQAKGAFHSQCLQIEKDN